MYVMSWEAITAIASVISMIAYVLTALYIRAELKAFEKDRYLAITSELFALWQSKEFMESQLWLLHRLRESNWSEFIRAHRADEGEVAFHRVGSFYDRVGTLVRLGLVNKDEILVTIGAQALLYGKKFMAWSKRFATSNIPRCSPISRDCSLLVMNVTCPLWDRRAR